MKLLLDQNLSRRMLRRLEKPFPGSQHVGQLGLGQQQDDRIWRHAAQHGFVVVSKDNDFRQLAFLHGPPPKVVWLDVGNAGTGAVCGLIEVNQERLATFGEAEDEALLVLSLGPRVSHTAAAS